MRRPVKAKIIVPPYVVGVHFVESTRRDMPSAKTEYHYFVPPHIPVPKVGDHLVVLGGQDMPSMVRVTTVLPPNTENKATKPVIGTVDLTHFEQERARRQRRNEILAGLEKLERKRQLQRRFEALAEDNNEAAELLSELKSIDRDEDH